MHFSIIFTFLLVPMWLKWGFAPEPFTPHYVFGFVIVAPIIVTFWLWVMTGCYGWQAFKTNRWLMSWLGLLALLTGWGLLSQTWAFGRVDYAGLAPSAGIQFMLVGIFSVVVISSKVPIKWVAAVLISSMLIHGSIGGLQVVIQSDIGLGWFGEFELNRAQSGISVLEANGQRWLRPYGLLPHPNILAGIILIGLLATLGWVLDTQKHTRLALAVFGIGFWFLLLTFSRGAWLGFIGGSLFALPFIWHRQHIWRRLISILMISAIVGMIFAAIFHPLLFSRVAVNNQNTEMRSIADRIVYVDIAWNAINDYPVRGVGFGNYPWYASHYIFYNTNFDLQGNPVHNIYLSVWSELGVVGLCLFGGIIISGVGIASTDRHILRIALLAGFFSWGVMGLFDHFMWTLVFTQCLWFGVLGVAMSGTTDALSSPIKD